MPNIESLVQQQSEVIADQLDTVAGFADSEEDLRVETEKVLEEFKREARIPNLKGKHERTIGKGRADSVYNYVVIEYKKPGRLSDDSDYSENQDAVEQIEGYISDLEKEENRSIEKFFGIGFDGYHFIFVRYRGGEKDVWTAKVSKASTERFLRALLALAADRKAFTPEYLAGDFGSESEVSIAPKGVQTFYRAVTHTDDEKAKVLFGQWKLLFAEVGGYDVSSFNKKIQTLAEYYGIEGKVDPAALLFSVQTYYALFMKLLAAEIMNYFGNSLFPSYLQKLRQANTSKQLLNELSELEVEGGIYHQLGISNFLEGNMFSWYLNAWETNDTDGELIDIEQVVRDMVNKLDEYDPLTLSVEPTQSRDLLKQLYENLFPRKVRHDLGEYYTPDWLAEYTIQQTGFEGDPEKRVLDPACGSGTFLVLAIQKMKEYNEKHLKYSDKDLLNQILNNVVGFDLNPLAVIAARLNFMIAIRDLIRYGSNMEIPIYLCDSVMTPFEHPELIAGDGATVPGGDITAVRRLSTSVGRFYLPTDIAENQYDVAKFADILERCVIDDYSEDEFLEALNGSDLPIEYEELHTKLFNQIVELNRQNRNGIWARIIKNAFAPLFISNSKVDYVIGNPPWVNWEHLPELYRQENIQIWEKYGLVGTDSRGKRQSSDRSSTDLSIIMTVAALDNYLSKGGRLGFVITETIFKSEQGGRRFRKFLLPNGIPFKIEKIDDLVRINPFEGATNRTAVMVAKKGEKTSYPVPYNIWSKKKRKKIGSKLSLEKVQPKVNILEYGANPIKETDHKSSWFVNSFDLSFIRSLIGKSKYADLARKGADTRGANGFFWLRLKERVNEDLILVSNDPSLGRKDVDQKEAVVEDDLVYPMLRGRDVKRWKADPQLGLLVTHDLASKSNPISEQRLKRDYPKTNSFLKHFEDFLSSRRKFRNFDPSKGEYYGLYSVNDYSFSKYKVVWRYISSDFTSAVISTTGFKDQSKTIVPDHKLVQIALDDKNEAYFVVGVLNSAISRYLVQAYTVSTQLSTHILENVPVPKYRSDNKSHQNIAELSEKAHQFAAEGNQQKLAETEQALDKEVAELWDISEENLELIQDELEMLLAL